jgi:hypothetical protein
VDADVGFGRSGEGDLICALLQSPLPLQISAMYMWHRATVVKNGTHFLNDLVQGFRVILLQEENVESIIERYRRV